MASEIVVEDMSPAERIYYKLCRITPGLEQSQGKWQHLAAPIRAAYENIAAAAPEVVPTMDEIRERDAEAGRASAS